MLEQDNTMASFGAATQKFKSAGGAEGNLLMQMRQGVMGSITPGIDSRAVGGSKEMMLGSTALPRVASAGGITGPIVGFAPLIIEPPSSLSNEVVVNRIEAQGIKFRKTTFTEYMKENDIFTGDPKVRFDQRRLDKEEEAILRKAQELVGGPAKRQLRLTKQR
jgi:hypothetical protein